MSSVISEKIPLQNLLEFLAGLARDNSLSCSRERWHCGRSWPPLLLPASSAASLSASVSLL